MFKLCPVALLLALSSCHAHVPLAAPSELDDVEQRIKVYNEYRPIFIHPEESLIGLKTGHYDYLVMQSGQVINHPEDLLPLVEPDSQVATEAQQVQFYQLLGGSLLAVSILGMLAYEGLFLYGLANQAETDAGVPGSTAALAPLLIPLALGGAVTGIGGTILYYYGQVQKNNAFEHFDADLQKKLGLCRAGEQWEACPETS